MIGPGRYLRDCLCSQVLVNGGPIALAELKESPGVGAIVDAFMPGQAAAEATFQLLLGEVSFSGLLRKHARNLHHLTTGGDLTDCLC